VEWHPTLTLSDGKPGGKRELKRPRCRWENIIKADLREMRKG
jgi:hypothetical protein